jgi:membrane associated rhomboid family serine protease
MGASSDRQPELPDWLRPVAARLSPFIKWLVIVESLAFLTFVMAPASRDFIVSQIALGPGMALGKVWQPASSLFVHVDLIQFVFNMVGIWFVASAMELALGRRRFLLVFFVPALIGNLAQGLVSAMLSNVFVASGCGLCVLSTFVAFGVHYGTTPARVLGRLVLPARTLAMILVGFSLAIELLSRAWPAVGGTTVAALLAYVLCGGPGEPELPQRPTRTQRPRIQMQVIEGGKGKTDPRYLN